MQNVNFLASGRKKDILNFLVFFEMESFVKTKVATRFKTVASSLVC